MPIRSIGRQLALMVLYWNEWQPVEDVAWPLEYLCSLHGEWLELTPDPDDEIALAAVSWGHLVSSRPLTLEDPAVQFARERVLRVLARRRELDQEIAAHSRRWRLERMAAIDRNILRLGAHELCFCPDVPAKVAINEAIELAKLFGTDDSPAFVNGVLDGLKRSLEEKVGKDG